MTDDNQNILETRPLGIPQPGSTNYPGEWRLVKNEGTGITEWIPYYLDEEEIYCKAKWMPLPGSQQLFLECPIFETLYEGTRAGGKTITLLMDFVKEVGKGYGKNWRGILFRKSFGDLDDIVKKIEEEFPALFPGFRFLKSKSEYRAEWPTGEALLLRHMRKPEDYDEFHGHEYPWIGWEELTQWGNDICFRLMISCCRSATPGIPCRIRSTTNPYGPGHNWVKKRYRLPEWRGRVIRIADQMPRVAIHGCLDENFILLQVQPDYKIQIISAARNAAQAEAWLKGDWNVTAGGMFDDIWIPSVHVIPDFDFSDVPASWIMTRAYDHGQSHPFSLGWWLESSGEPLIMSNGRQIGRIRGDLIRFAEWYGTTGNENQGVRMSASNIGEGIFDREVDMGLRHPHIKTISKVHAGPADTEIYNKQSDRNGRCPGDDMEDQGVYFERADKSPGSRKRGWQMIRNYLEDAVPASDGTRERPGIFICDRCRHWIDLVPSLPRDSDDEDDVPKGVEDHLGDETRYRSTWEIPRMWRKGF